MAKLDNKNNKLAGISTTYEIFVGEPPSYIPPPYEMPPIVLSGASAGMRNAVPRTEQPLMAPGRAGAMGTSLSYHIANLQGVGARSRQEDSFTFVNAFDKDKMDREGLLFVVCDGMGGMKDGKVASETAIASFRQSFVSMDIDGDIPAQLRESVFRASEEVEAQLQGEGGSTAVVGIIYKEMLYYVSVGDSFLYLKRGNELYRLNKEHNMCNQLYLEGIREGNLDPTPARSNRESAALTGFLGMMGLTEVDGLKKPYKLRENDVILACSDGVGGVLSEQETLNALQMYTPDEMCQAIEKGIVIHNKSNQDNYTALVINCLL